MAYRFTNTNKWNDGWFVDLKPTAKLLFMYLCDQCTNSGVIEINEKKIAFDLGADKQAIKGALCTHPKGRQAGGYTLIENNMSKKESIDDNSMIFWTHEQMMSYIGKYSMRICAKCEKELFANNFSMDPDEEMGRSKICKRCAKIKTN